MKKALGYIALGYALSELHDAWRRGYFSRAVEFAKGHAEAGDEFNFRECYEYVAQEPWPGKKATEEREATEYPAKRPRIQAMKSEGYSNAEIAEMMDLSETLVEVILEPEDTAEEEKS